MLLDLKFSIGTLGIGSGAFVASLYGMNLKNFIEESGFAFFTVSGWAFIFSGIICMYGLHKLRRTQRLSMWGEGGKGRKGWLSHFGPGTVPPTNPVPGLPSRQLNIKALVNDREAKSGAKVKGGPLQLVTTAGKRSSR